MNVGIVNIQGYINMLNWSDFFEIFELNHINKTSL